MLLVHNCCSRFENLKIAFLKRKQEGVMRTSLTFAALVFCLTFSALAQQSKSSGENAQPHHLVLLVVPLTSKGLSSTATRDFTHCRV
jgi:hypothetical protein